VTSNPKPNKYSDYPEKEELEALADRLDDLSELEFVKENAKALSTEELAKVLRVGNFAYYAIPSIQVLAYVNEAESRLRQPLPKWYGPS